MPRTTVLGSDFPFTLGKKTKIIEIINMEKNIVCVMCTEKEAKHACRCTEPPTFLCSGCLGLHVSKIPEVCHKQTSICDSDLE